MHGRESKVAAYDIFGCIKIKHRRQQTAALDIVARIFGLEQNERESHLIDH